MPGSIPRMTRPQVSKLPLCTWTCCTAAIHVAKAPLQRATFIDRCSTADVIGYLHDRLCGFSDLRA